MKNEVTVKTKSKREKVSKVKSLLLSAGKKIGSVHFVKKNGKVRKMCYRVFINHAKWAPGFHTKRVKNLLAKDAANQVMTIFDVNKVTYGKDGRPNGRGTWRSIPLTTVFRIKANGVVTKFV